MARTAKKAAAKPAAPSKSSFTKAASSPPPNLERPAEPKRFKASEEQLLDFYKRGRAAGAIEFFSSSRYL